MQKTDLECFITDVKNENFPLESNEENVSLHAYTITNEFTVKESTKQVAIRQDIFGTARIDINSPYLATVKFEGFSIEPILKGPSN